MPERKTEILRNIDCAECTKYIVRYYALNEYLTIREKLQVRIHTTHCQECKYNLDDVRRKRWEKPFYD